MYARNSSEEVHMFVTLCDPRSSIKLIDGCEVDGESVKHVTLSENSGLITAHDLAEVNSIEDEGVFEVMESLQPASQDAQKQKSSRGPGDRKEFLKSYRIPCPSGSKDRHSKVMTSRGPRDRRLRLSVETAIRFFDVQDRLGFDQPSRAVEWLIERCQSSIDKLPQISTSPLITNQCLENELASASPPKRGTTWKSTTRELKTKKPKTFTKIPGVGQRKGEALRFHDNIGSSKRGEEGSDGIGRYLTNMQAHDLTSTLGLQSNNNILPHQTSFAQSTNNSTELNPCFNANHAQLIEAHYYLSQQEGSSVLSFTDLNLTTFPVPSCPFPAHLLHSLTSDLQSTTTNF